MKTISQGWWCGSCWATEDDYKSLLNVYGKQSIAKYFFNVENNLRRVEVSDHPMAKCGVWTLANMKARYDLTPRQIAGMAAKMRRAVEVYEEGQFDSEATDGI